MTTAEPVKNLNQVLQHCQAAPFYRGRIPGDPLTSLNELKQIPLTTRDDLQRHSPFGLVCVPRDKLYQYHESFGTTGSPVSTWLTREDLDDCADQINASGLNLTASDIVLVRFPYAISTIAHLVHRAAQSRGAAVIPASSRSTISPFPRIVSLLRKLEVTVLAGLPLQVLLIAETAELLGYNPKVDFPCLRAIFTGGEPLSPSRHRLLTSTWGVPVIDNYGMTEIGPAVVDCEFGHPHPLEDYFFFEVLGDDLQSETAVGDIGNLVITTLRREAVPLVRYVTRDRARLVPSTCSCGSRYSLEVRGRKEDTIAIGDRELDRWDLDEIISHLPYQHYWAAGPSSGSLRIVIEEEKTAASDSPDSIQRLEEQLRLRLEIEVVAPGTLCDRSQLLSMGEVGKPRFIYSEKEMIERAYLKSARI